MFATTIKKARFIAAAAVIAASSTSAFAQDAMGVVNKYLVAWNAQNSTVAASILAEDARYYDSALGATVEGREEAKAQVIDAFMNAAPDIYWNLVGSPVISGQQVAFEWVLGGTNTGDWADGTPATGKSFRIYGMSNFTVEGDKVIAQSDYYDALNFYKQLGLD
ncbi:hypothetical protein GCM10007094_35470 [Pseudovibrio japonicus]|uniref:SnoaL-like domain-containing protein n=1 Tax=Pseudovibrio japonicus TaxID=366534 RepID=A0ABQ3ENB7_9HYPH|nr:nuclear transport factor 2 family protein [Pseudovibrio japonicus]GHB43010.1 hypothetical protein GCM10007094_35470 [Pseudovibrio japonicus]